MYRQLLVAVLASLSLGLGSTPIEDLRVEPLALEGLGGEQAAIAVWAADLFEQGGLDLPPLTIRRHDSTSACFERNGAYRVSEGRHVIEICTTESGPYAETLFLHEMAHAWAEHALTEERRMAFRQLRGFEYWMNYEEASWHENGTEQAADIIVWGLLDRPIKPIRIMDNSCAELMAGYLTLTGLPPLHGYLDLCDLSVSDVAAG